MRCCFSTMLSIFGVLMLAVGGFALYTALALKPDLITATLGGASVPVQDVAQNAAQGNLDLPVTINGEPTTTNNLGGAVVDSTGLEAVASAGAEQPSSEGQVEAEVQEDVSTQSFDVYSDNAVSNTQFQVNPVQSNEVLTADTNVQMVGTAGGGNGEGVSDGQGGANAGVQTESRIVELEWPEKFRAGESNVVRVTMKALANNTFQLSVAEIKSNTVLATPIFISDYYTTHTAQVTARLVAPEFEIESNNSATQGMERGQDVSWRWTLTPKDTGTFAMTLGIEIYWLPIDPNADPAIGPLPVWGQAVQTEVDHVVGNITIPQASTAGAILGVIGFVSQLPFAGEVFSLLFERNLERRADRRRQRQVQRDMRRRR